MSLQTAFPTAIPDDTRRVGEVILKDNDVCRFLGEHIEAIITPDDVNWLYAETGRPGVHPLLLLVVTVFQFWEQLPDRKASEQAVKRLDWKYALRQELTWMGFHFSDLCHFRQRLLDQEAGGLLFDKVVAYLLAQGYLKVRKGQRTDSTHVIGQVSRLSRIELKWESLRLALSALMSVNADWTLTQIGTDTVARYSQSRATYRMSQPDLAALDTELEQASQQVLRLVETTGEADWLKLPSLQLLYQVLREQASCFPVEKWRVWEQAVGDADQPGEIHSPHDPQARYSEKRGQGWIGYKTHLTESLPEADGSHFITDTLVTLAPQHDSVALKDIQARLAARQVLPAQQYVDQGYMSAAHIASSVEHGIDLRGEVQPDASSKPVGFRLCDFTIDLKQQVATCPLGRQSVRWSTVHGTDGVAFRAFFGKQCRRCPHFADKLCTALPAGRRLDINLYHDLLQARRREQVTPNFRHEMKRRAGVEGLISEAVRAHDLRHSRYRGLAKNQLQADFTATAVNLKRLMTCIAA